MWARHGHGHTTGSWKSRTRHRSHSTYISAHRWRTVLKWDAQSKTHISRQVTFHQNNLEILETMFTITKFEFIINNAWIYSNLFWSTYLSRSTSQKLPSSKDLSLVMARLAMTFTANVKAEATKKRPGSAMMRTPDCSGKYKSSVGLNDAQI